MADKERPVKVSDRSTEQSAKITNYLMTAIFMLVGWVGLSTQTKLEKISDNLAKVAIGMAVTQEVDKRQDEDIKKFKKWKESHNLLHNKESE